MVIVVKMKLYIGALIQADSSNQTLQPKRSPYKKINNVNLDSVKSFIDVRVFFFRFNDSMVKTTAITMSQYVQ